MTAKGTQAEIILRLLNEPSSMSPSSRIQMIQDLCSAGFLGPVEPSPPDNLDDALYELEQAETERDAFRETAAARAAALSAVSGALTDAGDIPVPDPEGYGDAVRALTAQRDELRAILKELEFVHNPRYDGNLCPCCAAFPSEGHDPECRLARALSPHGSGSEEGAKE